MLFARFSDAGLKKFVRGCFPAAVIAAAAAFWFWGSWYWDFDDAFSMEMIFAREPVAKIVSEIPWNDQSPLFYLLLHFWKYFGESPNTVRVLLALIQSASLYIIYRMCRDFWGRHVAEASLLLIAFSCAFQWPMRSGGRMYPLLVLASVASVYAAFKYLENRNAKYLAFLAAASAVNIYSHFFGFYITAWIFLGLFAGTSWREFFSRRGLLPPVLCASGLLALVAPQVKRAAELAQHAPLQAAAWSLSPDPVKFLGQALTLIFKKTDKWAEWGVLQHFVEPVFWSAFAVLFILGLVRAGRRAGFTVFLLCVGSIGTLALLSGRFDLRDRYMIYAVPFAYMMAALAAFGPPVTAGPRLLRAGIAAARKALFAAVFVPTIWLSFSSLDARYSEWTKLMTAIDRIYVSTMSLMMPTAHTLKIPAYTADWNRLYPVFGEVSLAKPSNRDGFLMEIQQGKTFVFLIHKGRHSAEQAWRIEHLKKIGYLQETVHAWLARAEILSRKTVPGLYRTLSVSSDRTPLLQWAAAELNRRRPARDGSDLEAALVARLADDTVQVSDLYMDQRGLYGYRKLPGTTYRDAVYEGSFVKGNVRKKALFAGPKIGKPILVGFPKLLMGKSIDLNVAGLPSEKFEMFLNGGKILEGTLGSRPEWKHYRVDTARLENKTAHLVLLFSTENPNSEGVWFRLNTAKPSVLDRLAAFFQKTLRSQRPESSWRHYAAPSNIRLPQSAKLSNRVGELRPSRIQPDGRRSHPELWDRNFKTADAMHERGGAANEGGVWDRWVLGPDLWDAVGATFQRSGDVLRPGVWAHPRNDSVLEIDAGSVKLDGQISGFVGFTDFAVERAGQQGLSEPVLFTVLLDSVPVLELNIPRAKGWQSFKIPTPSRDGALAVRVETKNHQWSHLVFDIWGE